MTIKQKYFITILLFSLHPKTQALIQNIHLPLLACKMHKTAKQKRSLVVKIHFFLEFFLAVFQ